MFQRRQKQHIRAILMVSLSGLHQPNLIRMTTSMPLGALTSLALHLLILNSFYYRVSTTPIKVATLSGYRSAIKDIYRSKRLPLPVDYGADMKTFFLV